MNFQGLLQRGADVLRTQHHDPGIWHDHALDAEVLLMHAAGLGRMELMLRAKEDVSPDVRERFETLLTRRAAHEPVAYLVGHKEFYGLEFSVGPGVLVPRPETEQLVELALQAGATARGAICFVDIGTGSGAIAGALARHLGGQHKIFATELSPAALTRAQQNFAALGVRDRVRLLPGNGIDPVFAIGGTKGCEQLFVLANLPYLPTHIWEQSMADVKDFEPREALDGGTDGCDLYRILFNQLEKSPLPFRALCEIDPSTTETLRAEALKRFPAATMRFLPDLSGKLRILDLAVEKRQNL